MTKKLRLELDEITVDSFELSAEEGRGTVRGHYCACCCCDPCCCTCCDTCQATCPYTCQYTCDDDTCAYTCDTCYLRICYPTEIGPGCYLEPQPIY
ncbi:MAG TPA: hypothetical protein VF771_17860 [Longimicrobiaceae bacterium]